MEISAAWGVLAVTVFGGLVAWNVRLERRFATFITRRDHEKQNGAQQTAVAVQLKEINDKLDGQNKDSHEHRELVSTQLHEIALDMVALQTQVGAPRRRKIQRGG